MRQIWDYAEMYELAYAIDYKLREKLRDRVIAFFWGGGVIIGKKKNASSMDHEANTARNC